MKIMNVVLIIIAGLVLGIGIFVGQQHFSRQVSATQGHHDKWYCPMHPQILYDHPGRCPICGMDLVKKISKPEEQSSKLEGYATVDVSASKQQLIGLKTDVVATKVLVKTIRAAGEYEGEVFAQVFEGDIKYIKVGQKAVVEIPALDEKYVSSVNSIDTSIDEISRTIRVRIWFTQNNQNRFKTNMFVNVEFPIELGRAIVVPRQAVMDTGLRKIVFVSRSENTFEPREIRTGMETDDGVEVLSGLKEGERIVVAGNFLLDSESRVQAGLEQGEAHDK